MIGMCRNVGGVIAAHLNVPFKRHVALKKFGVPCEMQLMAGGDRFEIQPPGEFMIKRQIAYMRVGVDLRRVECARALQREIGPSFDRQLFEMNLPDAGNVEIFSAQIQPEAARRRRVGRAAVNHSVLMREVNVVQPSLSPADLKIGVEPLDRFAVGGCVRCRDVTLRLGMSPGSADLQRDIGDPGNRIVDSGQFGR